MDKKTQLRGGLFCLIAAAVLLTVCSMNSWLYPVNSWVDVNILTTVGRGMFDSRVPYRDLVDHKGPLIYFLFGLGTVMTPGSYHGLFVLETLAVAAAMFFGWKTICLYVPKVSPVWMAPLFVTLFAAKIFQSGGSAEEFVLLPFAWSLYDLLKCWRTDEPMKPGALLRNGVLAGCVLCVKFNLLSFHFVWMAALALNALWRERRLLPVVRMCLTFLAGMALACLPWVIYFAANGALMDLLDGYLLKNLFGYGAGGDPVFRSMLTGVYTLMTNGPIHFALLAVAGISVLVVPRRLMAVREKVTLVCMAALLVATVYSRMATNVYYGVVFAVFLPFALLPLRLARRRPALPAWAGGLAAAATLGVCAAFALAASDYTVYAGVDYEDTPQAQIAKVIRREGDGDSTLLQYRSMDFGFYLAADVWPADAMFTFMNIRQEECLARQREAVEQGVPDFVVMGQPERSEILQFEKYDLIFETVSNYGSEAPENMSRFLLYKRAAE